MHLGSAMNGPFIIKMHEKTRIKVQSSDEDSMLNERNIFIF